MKIKSRIEYISFSSIKNTKKECKSKNINYFNVKQKYSKKVIEEINFIIDLVGQDWTIEEFPNKIDWNGLSSNSPYVLVNSTEERTFGHAFPSSNFKLSEEFIRTFKDRVNWEQISYHQNLSENFIREFHERLNWNRLLGKQKLSEDFLREFHDRLDWNVVCVNQELSENFIRDFQSDVNWLLISQYQKLSLKFIYEFKYRVYNNAIARNQRLSESFIRRMDVFIGRGIFANSSWRCWWANVSENQKLSESFIREHKNKVDWHYISMCQKLSESFIEEFKNKIIWHQLSINKCIRNFSPEFILRHQDKLDWSLVLFDFKPILRKQGKKFEIVLKDLETP